ncbi:hypothetical protein FKM82_011160 [Ascaphus truei]
MEKSLHINQKCHISVDPLLYWLVLQEEFVNQMVPGMEFSQPVLIQPITPAETLVLQIMVHRTVPRLMRLEALSSLGVEKATISKAQLHVIVLLI